MRAAIAAAAALFAAPAWAQPVTPISPPVTKGDLAALAASIPKLADTVPLGEVMGGAAGSSPMAMRADVRIPRITQSPIVTTVTGGTFSATFPAGFFAAPPTISLTWVNTSGLYMTCELSADPTPTLVQGRCRTISLTAILNAGAGIKVHLVALPQN